MQDEKYNDCTDEEIISKIKIGDKAAIDYLLDKYKYLVRKKATALFLIGGEKEDLIQEGMIGLYKSIRDFQQGKENSFYNFADMCISRQMYNAINASNRKKNIPLNTYISLYTPITNEREGNDENAALVDTMYEFREQNPENLIIDRENTSMIEQRLEERLSSMESQVLHYYMEGMGYVEIAKQLEKEPKSVDNALQRIKTKLSQVLNEISE